ncbi:MAG TPA: hypothetical protein PLZ66_06215 [Rectinema sp.]|nr:hypothetical protein [Rectinema sp.]
MTILSESELSLFLNVIQIKNKPLGIAAVAFAEYSSSTLKPFEAIQEAHNRLPLTSSS